MTRDTIRPSRYAKTMKADGSQRRTFKTSGRSKAIAAPADATQTTGRSTGNSLATASFARLPSGERRMAAASVSRPREGAGAALAVAASDHRRANGAGVHPLQRLVRQRSPPTWAPKTDVQTRVPHPPNDHWAHVRPNVSRIDLVDGDVLAHGDFTCAKMEIVTLLLEQTESIRLRPGGDTKPEGNVDSLGKEIQKAVRVPSPDSCSLVCRTTCRSAANAKVALEGTTAARSRGRARGVAAYAHLRAPRVAFGCCNGRLAGARQ